MMNEPLRVLFDSLRPLLIRFSVLGLTLGLMAKATLSANALLAQSPPISSSTTSLIDFEGTIRPIFRKHCVACHGKNRQEGGLRLDAHRFAIQGGSSGAVWKGADPSASHLFLRVTSKDPEDRMPPEKEPLAPESVELLRQWIVQGAPWEETEEDWNAASDDRRSHWAWQPIQPPRVPKVQDSQWPKNPVDLFILANLESKRLSPSPEADKRTLIRRLSLDLLGLPPTDIDVDTFLADDQPGAYERLVEKMLASPRYGERWARHWLDIAHYADTHGFERDQRRDHAWRYRDYVIQSLNQDKPYKQFILEQIAGDALNPTTAEQVVATGFLAAGPWDFVGQAETPSPVIKRLARADDLDDMVTQVMAATCAVTLNCARCHDHKLDPISQREYYSMWSAFAGAKRANRNADPIQAQQWEHRKAELENAIGSLRAELASLQNGLRLADIIGGGDGTGNGKVGNGIHLLTGKPQVEPLTFLEDSIPNRYVEVEGPWIDGVVLPDGNEEAGIVISSTGLRTRSIPATSGKAWDAIRNGPVNSQKSTRLGDVDYQADGHSLIGLHANAALTIDLQPFRKGLNTNTLYFQTDIGYGGRPEPSGRESADVRILLDGAIAFSADRIGPTSAKISLNIPIPDSIRFLTLVATDGGNEIGHDQVFFGDPILRSIKEEDATRLQRAQAVQSKLDQLVQEIKEGATLDQVFAIQSDSPPDIFVLQRGNPEQPGEAVKASSIGCLTQDWSETSFDASTDPQRRLKVAQWLTSESHPTTKRVIVNRLWQHHFGTGIVDTPSDFGMGGSKPSHPELLDWLATTLGQSDDSLKEMQRLLVCSATYRQSSRSTNGAAEQIDAGNRWLWRQNSRRIDAETLRDSVLHATHCIDYSMYGPGFQDFEYQEEYAPIYQYVVPRNVSLWRRSVYRFIVRTTPHPFLTPLDCPSPSQISPTRTTTTTAVQSLALWNNGFILNQSSLLADDLSSKYLTQEARVDQAFRSVLNRSPSKQELLAAEKLLQTRSLDELCRALLNSNEFSVVD